MQEKINSNYVRFPFVFAPGLTDYQYITEAKFVKGSYIVLSKLEDRDALHESILVNGLIVFVAETGLEYRYNNGEWSVSTTHLQYKGTLDQFKKDFKASDLIDGVYTSVLSDEELKDYVDEDVAKDAESPETLIENIDIHTNESSVKNGLYVSQLNVSEGGTYFIGGDDANYIFGVEVITDGSTYVLDASTLDAFDKSQSDGSSTYSDGYAIPCGTNNYFNLICKAGKTAVNSSSKTFLDGRSFTKRINFGGSTEFDEECCSYLNGVKFVCSNAATIKVWWVAGDAGRQVRLYKTATTSTVNAQITAEDKPSFNYFSAWVSGTQALVIDSKNHCYRWTIANNTIEELVNVWAEDKPDTYIIKAPENKNITINNNVTLTKPVNMKSSLTVDGRTHLREADIDTVVEDLHVLGEVDVEQDITTRKSIKTQRVKNTENIDIHTPKALRIGHTSKDVTFDEDVINSLVVGETKSYPYTGFKYDPDTQESYPSDWFVNSDEHYEIENYIGIGSGSLYSGNPLTFEKKIESAYTIKLKALTTGRSKTWFKIEHKASGQSVYKTVKEYAAGSDKTNPSNIGYLITKDNVWKDFSITLDQPLVGGHLRFVFGSDNDADSAKGAYINTITITEGSGVLNQSQSTYIKFTENVDGYNDQYDGYNNYSVGGIEAYVKGKKALALKGGKTELNPGMILNINMGDADSYDEAQSYLKLDDNDKDFKVAFDGRRMVQLTDSRYNWYQSFIDTSKLKVYSSEDVEIVAGAKENENVPDSDDYLVPKIRKPKSTLVLHGGDWKDDSRLITYDSELAVGVQFDGTKPDPDEEDGNDEIFHRYADKGEGVNAGMKIDFSDGDAPSVEVFSNPHYDSQGFILTKNSVGSACGISKGHYYSDYLLSDTVSITASSGTGSYKEFIFTPTESGEYEVHLGYSNPWLYIYDSNNGLIYSAKGKYNHYINLTAGKQYRIRIQFYTGYSTFTFYLRQRSNGYNKNYFSKELIETYDVNITTPDEVKTFYFTPDSTSKYRIRHIKTEDSNDYGVEIHIYDSNDTEILATWDTDKCYTDIDLTESEQYRIETRFTSTMITRAYSLHVQKLEYGYRGILDADDDGCFNYSKLSFTVLEDNTNLELYIDAFNDNSNDASATILFSNLNTELSKFMSGNDLNLYESVTLSEGDGASIIYENLTAGEYFITIKTIGVNKSFSRYLGIVPTNIEMTDVQNDWFSVPSISNNYMNREKFSYSKVKIVVPKYTRALTVETQKEGTSGSFYISSAIDSVLNYSSSSTDGTRNSIVTYNNVYAGTHYIYIRGKSSSDLQKEYFKIIDISCDGVPLDMSDKSQVELLNSARGYLPRVGIGTARVDGELQRNLDNDNMCMVFRPDGIVDIRNTITKHEDEYDFGLDEVDKGKIRVIADGFDVYDNARDNKILSVDTKNKTLALNGKNVSSDPIVYTNVRVAKLFFTEDSTHEGYPYKATIPLDRVTANMMPTVTFNASDAGRFAPVCETYDGGIYIWSSTNDGVEIPSIKFEPVEVTNNNGSEGLEFTSNGDGTCSVSGIGECIDTNIVVPSVSQDFDSVRYIHNNAFYHNKYIKNIEISDSVIQIKSGAFEGCSNLEKIEIPNSIDWIGTKCFLGCDALSYVNYKGTVDDWVQISNLHRNYANPIEYSESLYINGELLTNANITSATKISAAAFCNCDSLTSVTIGSRVTSIGDWAFSGCTSLMNIIFLGTIAQWQIIQKGGTWNQKVPATKVICSDGEVLL